MTKIALTCFLLTTLLAACNTIQGAGQDISGAGKGISNTAEKVKQKL